MVLKLDRRKKTPLYMQIKNSLSSLIEEGNPAAGSRLPATRELAASLDVSRNTVVLAYQELGVSGLISSNIGKGSFVAYHHRPLSPLKQKSSVGQKMSFEGLYSANWTGSYSPLLATVAKVLDSSEGESTISFAAAQPDHRLFPIADFKGCLQSAMRKHATPLLMSGPARGFQPLLDYLPAFIARRGVSCDSTGLMIVSGMQQGLSLVGRLLINPGDTVLLENLTYPGAQRIFRSLQASCIGVPMDGQGIRIDVLENVLRRRDAKLLYTIPTFQNPTNTELSFERRRALAEICRRHQVIIIEDDYAHELGFEGRELLPLKAFDDVDGIIYMGSFSEILFPGIRLSWILAPRQILERLLLIKESSDLYTNRILQGGLLEFCRRGYLEKHLKKTRVMYRKRRDAMLAAIKECFPKEATTQKCRGGLFQWVDLPERIDAMALLLKSREDGVVFAPDRLFSVEEWERSGFRLGFGNVGEEDITKGIGILGRNLKKAFAVKS